MKRLIALLTTVLLTACLAVPAFAAATPVVTYNGSSELAYTDESGNALSGDGDFGTAFSSMLPGVTYSQSITLKNTSENDQVRFYMSLDVIKTLQADKLDGAGYAVTLTSTKETLFSSVNGAISGTLIGGSGSNAELADLNKDLYDESGTGILVATLAPGESETLTLSIKADATMSNAYQSAQGALKFQFFAQMNSTTGTTTTVYVPGQTIVKTVQTGDNSPIYIAAAAMGAAVVILLLTVRKKKKKD